MWHIAAILVALLSTDIAYSSDKPNLKTAETKNSAETEQRGSDNNPLTIKVLPATDADTKSRQEEKYRNEKAIQEKEMVDATIWLVRITAILALFTGGLWWATYRLSRDARKTATQQAKDMERSLRIAQESADAAKKSSDAAERTVSTISRTAEHDLRAYVGVESIQMRDPNTDQLRGVITIANFGKTMAKDLEFWIAGAFEIATGQEFHWGDRKLKTAVMPEERVMYEESIMFGKHNREMMDQGSTNAILWGKITYTDLFGKNHWTIFRFVTYEREGNGWKIRASQEGNNAGDGEPPPPLTS